MMASLDSPTFSFLKGQHFQDESGHWSHMLHVHHHLFSWYSVQTFLRYCKIVFDFSVVWVCRKLFSVTFTDWTSSQVKAGWIYTWIYFMSQPMCVVFLMWTASPVTPIKPCWFWLWENLQCCYNKLHPLLYIICSWLWTYSGCNYTTSFGLQSKPIW